MTYLKRPDNQGIYPGKELLNRDFAYETLQTNLKIGNYRILHLATHGAFRAGRIEDSYFVFGRGESITTELIDRLSNYGLNKIHLVVLSTCETGVGARNSSGIEISGISYFFRKNQVTGLKIYLSRVRTVMQTVCIRGVRVPVKPCLIKLRGSSAKLKDSTTSIKESPTSIKDSTTRGKGSVVKFQDSPASIEVSTMNIKVSTMSIKHSTMSIKHSPTSMNDSTRRFKDSTMRFKGSSVSLKDSIMRFKPD